MMPRNICFHHFVDDGVQKLRMLETVARADFGKILEPDGQAKFPRLHLFPAQLAGQPRGLAQHESQRRLVIVFVLRQRGAAGNRRPVFDFQNQRLIPLPV